LGYAPGIFERQKFLERLHATLDTESKQKVFLNKKVVKIQNSQGLLTVKCADGTEFIGDTVAGADGFHSRVRQEMQRLMRRTNPSKIPDENSEFANLERIWLSIRLMTIAITAEYSCIFGLSRPMSKLEPQGMTVARDVGCSTALFVSKDHHPRWFFISKMDKLHQGNDIPRYTKAQMELVVSKHAEFQFTEGVTLKELVTSATQISYQALEEAHYKVWTFERIVCVGDSIHKMTPTVSDTLKSVGVY
jgi:2-polyprenyl-6-methoxyphenol hydroxylase-like FAD-dependent oxidoreductase